MFSVRRILGMKNYQKTETIYTNKQLRMIFLHYTLAWQLQKYIDAEVI